MEPATLITLDPIGSAELTMAEPLVLTDGPKGTRVIVDLLEGTFSGRISGILRGRASADWILIGPDGTGALDVRCAVETDDGALIYMECRGRVDFTRIADEPPSLLAMIFETGDDRYRWLNKCLALVHALPAGERQLRYTIFEVKPGDGMPHD